MSPEAKINDGGQNGPVIGAIDLSAKTEADVETKVIWPLLTGPNCLEIPSASIKGKDYLAPTVLDKKAGKTGGYYPDFSVWEAALPTLIVEAKAPEVAAEVGYREASLYARHLNQEYKTGVNPCHIVVACNGTELLAGHWDSKSELELKVADIRVGSAGLEALRKLCHHRVLVAHAAKALAAIRLANAV